MNNIAIIHTVSSLWRSSGVTDAAVNAVNGAAKAGNNVTIAVWSGAQYIGLQSLHPNVKVISLVKGRFFIKNLYSFYTSLKTRITFLKKNHDHFVIHDHGLWLESNIAAALVARNMGIPLIISSHGMLEPWAMEHHSWKKKIAWILYQKWVLKTAKAIHVTAKAESSAVMRLLPKSLIIKIALGTVYTKYISICQNHQAIFLSRIHKVKGIDLLLAAWKLSAPPSWSLILVGPGEVEYVGQVQQKIQELGLQGRVKLLGAVYGEDKSKLFTESSLFILPSYSENFGLVVAEAMMAGLPVITSNATPWLNLDKRGVGWTISPNVKDLSTAIQKATALKSEQRLAMGEIARNWMIEEFTWTAYQNKVNKLYLDVTNDRV